MESCGLSFLPRIQWFNNIYRHIPLMRNSETSWEAPAPWASMKPATSKQVGKSETLSDHNPCSWHSTIHSEGSPQLPAFSWGGKKLDHESNIPTFLGPVQGIASISPVSVCWWDLAYSRHLEASENKDGGLHEHASNHHSPSLVLHVEQTGEKPPDSSSSLGREQVGLHVQNFHRLSNGLASVLPILERWWDPP